jgi:opacity protein-like surface antigen
MTWQVPGPASPLEGALVGRLGFEIDGLLPYVDAGVAFANATRNET